MGVLKDAWETKKKMEKGMQDMGHSIGRVMTSPGASGITPMEAGKTVVKAIAHIPAAIFDSSTLPKKKKK